MKQVVVSAFIVDERNRVLMSRRAENGKYCPPGGKVEKGESLVESLIREIKEEINLDVVSGDMVLLGFCDLPGKVIFFYLILKWSGWLFNREPTKHGDWEWLKNMPRDRECVDGVKYFKRELWSHLNEQLSIRTSN